LPRCAFESDRDTAENAFPAVAGQNPGGDNMTEAESFLWVAGAFALLVALVKVPKLFSLAAMVVLFYAAWTLTYTIANQPTYRCSTNTDEHGKRVWSRCY
jgi:hypothetical protein